MQKYRKLLRYARPQRRFFLLIFALTVVSSVFLAVQPWPMKLVVDNVLGQKPLPAAAQPFFEPFLGPITPMQLLIVAVLGGLALFAVSCVLEALLAWSWTVAGRRMVYALAEDLF